MSRQKKVNVIALATRNAGKVEEIRLGLGPIEIKTVDDFPRFPEVEETEPDLHGNAALKSKALYEFSGVPSLADDTGLEVAVLGGAPGVLSARYAGEGCTPADNRRLLLDQLRGLSDRRARFRTVLAFTDEDGTHFFEGTCEGEILIEERGTGGFGYDAIFQPDGSAQSFAELTTEAKNRISHRGKALQKFFRFVHEHLESQ